MIKKCLGCGSVLQSENVTRDGFVKLSVYDKSDYCERCFKIKNYGEYSILDKKIDFDGIVRNINSDNLSHVVFLIDSLNISPNLTKYINKFKNKKYILLTKKDMLPKSVKDKKLVEYFKDNIYDNNFVMCISSNKNYNIDKFMNVLKEDNVRRLYVVGFTNAGKSTFINHILTSISEKPVITTSSVPNTTASYITIKINSKLTIVDTPGFIDEQAIYNFLEYNKVTKLYPNKEIRVKTIQIKKGYAVVVNDLLRIENIGEKNNSFTFYMSDKLRYEKINIKNSKLSELPSMIYTISDKTDIVINGLGFVKISKEGIVKVHTLSAKMITSRRSMI